jgi:hypothetical protein
VAAVVPLALLYICRERRPVPATATARTADA